MLKRTPRYRLQVPHGLAILGALLLLAGTVTGLGGTQRHPEVAPGLAVAGYAPAGESEAADRVAEPVESMHQAPLRKSKRFKVNLFLFRR